MLNHGSQGMLSCMVPATASCVITRWVSSVMLRTMRDRPPANHDGCIAPLHLVARKVPDWIQATCHRVSRTLRSNACLHRLSHRATR